MRLLQEYPETPKQQEWKSKRMPDKIDWEQLMSEVLRRGTDVPALSFWKAGEDEAYAVSLSLNLCMFIVVWLSCLIFMHLKPCCW